MSGTLLGLALALILVVGAIIVILARRSHLRSWRFGVFYESEESYEQHPEKEEKDE